MQKEESINMQKYSLQRAMSLCAGNHSNLTNNKEIGIDVSCLSLTTNSTFFFCSSSFFEPKPSEKR